MQDSPTLNPAWVHLSPLPTPFAQPKTRILHTRLYNILDSFYIEIPLFVTIAYEKGWYGTGLPASSCTLSLPANNHNLFGQLPGRIHSTD